MKTAPKSLVLIASYLIITIGVTWPLALSLSSTLPLGTEGAFSVPLLNLWSMKWTYQSFLSGFSNYWNAPHFFPETETFALSDPQIFTGIIFSLFQLITNDAVVTYNLVVILILSANALATYFLLRTWGAETIPAFLSGILGLTLPFVFNELGVLQLTAIYPILLAISLNTKYYRDKKTSDALLVGLFTALSFLTSGYYGIYLSIFLLLSIIFYLRKEDFSIKLIRDGLLAVLLCSILIFPTVSKQFSVSSEYSRSRKSIHLTSANLNDYRRLHKNTVGYNYTPWVDTSDNNKQRLYPGSALIALLLIYLAYARRNRVSREAKYCICAAFIALVLSLGLKFNIGNWYPYDTFRNFYPGMANLRSPFRFAIMNQIFLLGIAGLSLNILWQDKKKLGKILALAFTTIGFIEVLTVPLRTHKIEESVYTEPWIQKLSELPEGAVAMVPFPKNGRTKSHEISTIYMLQALEHGKKIFNGYSGYFPETYQNLANEMQSFPTEQSLIALKALGGKYIVIENYWLYRRPYAKNVVEEFGYKEVFKGSAKTIFQLS